MINLGLNPGLQDRWQTLYSLDQWLGEKGTNPILIYTYKQDLALDNLQGFLCYKTQQTNPFGIYTCNFLLLISKRKPPCQLRL